MGHPRPAIRSLTTLRLTQADIENSQTIADALYRHGVTDFPTRAQAVRLALRATAGHLRRTGTLPAGFIG